MDTWKKYGLVPYGKKNRNGVYVILTFEQNPELPSLLVRQDCSILGEVHFNEAIELITEIAEANMVKDREPTSRFGPRPASYYPAEAVALYIDEDSAHGS